MAHVSALTRKLVSRRVEQQMLDTVTILRGSLGELDEVTGMVGGLTNTKVIYAGKARVASVNGSGAQTLGEGQIDTRSTSISIPLEASPIPARDDLVLVGVDASDDDVERHIYRVLDVDGGGYVGAVRRLSCTSFYPSRYWGEQ